MQRGYSIQRFRGGFAVVWIDDEGKRRRRRLYAADRLGAEAEARQRVAAGTGPLDTLGEIIPAYIADRAAKGLKSAQRRRDAWKAMRPVWENVSPANIDEAACRHWASIRKASAATIRYELSMIATATNWAERQGLIEKAVQVWLPPPPPRKDRHISRQQFASFMENVLAPHARLYAILGISTAARPGAILELTWQQIDFDRRLINLNPEDRQQTTKRRATVPMTEQAEYALREAWDMRSTHWVVEYAGKRVANIKRAFQAASKRSGIHVTPYTLRHSAAVWMAESGVPMEEIAAYLGHSDTRTTFQHYAKYSPDYLRKAAKALSW